ncbi:MAG: cell division regulator GpsB [Firmicutes bacterium]|uniref:Cell division regulator GpsB n=1 Tax=Candidatus Gallilactobacillus intestinavium TaxID=2840838 RepID=A0A9D9E5X0_9LACO|nr:cell division regulator GpsB [Candidatus Gallilactobacillus intestinavium]
MDGINYTTQDILQKEFKEKRVGVAYDPTDVDSFLDNIIKDYEVFNREIARLKAENQQLNDKVEDLNKQLSVSGNVNVKPRTAVNSSATQTNNQTNSDINMEILKRLSNLERRVYGQSGTTTDSSNSSDTLDPWNN